MTSHNAAATVSRRRIAGASPQASEAIPTEASAQVSTPSAIRLTAPLSPRTGVSQRAATSSTCWDDEYRLACAQVAPGRARSGSRRTRRSARSPRSPGRRRARTSAAARRRHRPSPPARARGTAAGTAPSTRRRSTPSAWRTAAARRPRGAGGAGGGARAAAACRARRAQRRSRFADRLRGGCGPAGRQAGSSGRPAAGAAAAAQPGCRGGGSWPPGCRGGGGTVNDCPAGAWRPEATWSRRPALSFTIAWRATAPPLPSRSVTAPEAESRDPRRAPMAFIPPLLESPDSGPAP